MSIKKIQVGDVFDTNGGGTITVIKYNNAKDVLIEHNDEWRHRSSVESCNIRAGGVKNPFRPSVYGLGYIGLGEYNVSINRKLTHAYKSWSSLLMRSSGYDIRRPTYEDCKVAKEWLNFQNFACWWHNQPNAGVKGFAVDKDLIKWGNKTYGPEFCSLVPQVINSLLTDSSRVRGSLPQGVTRVGDNFGSQLSVDGTKHYLGTFKTPEEAYKCYKKAKVKNVRRMADKYKDCLDPRVYNNLMTWESV
jgi:hypothetical protein